MSYMHHFILILAVTLLRKCNMRAEETPMAIVRVRVEKSLAANSSLSNNLYPLPAAKASVRGAADGRGGTGGERSGTLGLMSPLNCRIFFFGIVKL